MILQTQVQKQATIIILTEPVVLVGLAVIGDEIQATMPCLSVHMLVRMMDVGLIIGNVLPLITPQESTLDFVIRPVMQPTVKLLN